MPSSSPNVNGNSSAQVWIPPAKFLDPLLLPATDSTAYPDPSVGELALGAVEDFSIDIERAHEFFEALEEIIDRPFFADSEKLKLSVALVDTSLDFALSVRLLCLSGQLLGASTCLRSQFEALVRSVWIFHCATDNQVSRLNQESLSLETQQGAKNIPQATGMLDDLEKLPHLLALTQALREFKDCAWQPLNSFVHSGIHAVHRTRFGSPPQLIDQTFRISNGFCMLGYNHLAVLTGAPGIQKEIMATTVKFTSVLPAIKSGT